MRDIKSRFHNDAPPVGKLHTQPSAGRRCADQFYRQQLCGWSPHSPRTFQMAIIVQRVKSQTTRFTKCLPSQPALLKIPYQAFRFCLAPTTSRHKLSRIPHALTSSRNRLRKKSGFARRDTFLLIVWDHWHWVEPNDGFAILHFEALLPALNKSTNLQATILDLLKYEWLPVEGRDFRVAYSRASANGAQIESLKFFPLI